MGEEIRRQRQIQEARSRDLHGRDTGQIGANEDFLGEIAWRSRQALGERHDAVRLVVAPIRRAQHRVGAHFKRVKGVLQP